MPGFALTYEDIQHKLTDVWLLYMPKKAYVVQGFNNPAALRKAGIEALAKELGPLGMALFLRQCDSGYGDYTKERDELLNGVTIEEVERQLGTIQ